MGKTGEMLSEALALRANAEQLPILSCGANFNHCDQLIRIFIKMAVDSGAKVEVRQQRRMVVLDKTDRYEFISFPARDEKYRGKEYSHVFVDHYAYDCINF